MPPPTRAGRARGARCAGRIAAAIGIVALPLLPLRGQACPTLVGPPGNPLRDGTPAFTITTSGVLPADLPLQLTLEVATQADFTGVLFADTTLTGVTAAAIVVPRLLPERISIWWRARVRTAQGALCFSNAIGPRQTSPWLALIAPNGLNGSTVDTRRPTFSWTSPAAHPPVKPWVYQLVIYRTSDGAPVLSGSSLTDTAFTAISDLESNTSYRWSVSAKLSTGDSAHVDSFASFDILDPNSPIATTLYTGFPSPFPNTRGVDRTCIWFDLARVSEVRLDILDLRGNFVTRILPRPGLGPVFPPGRYGRATVGSDAGCNDQFTWDGRDQGGRSVPPGVYLIRFVADRSTKTTAVVWRGR